MTAANGGVGVQGMCICHLGMNRVACGICSRNMKRTFDDVGARRPMRELWEMDGEDDK